jgi:hypothetical protein
MYNNFYSFSNRDSKKNFMVPQTIGQMVQNQTLQKDESKGLQGPKGEQGDIGQRGHQGIPGKVGEKGDTGPKGEQGIQGPVGEKGLQGPVGEKGDAGPKGDTGEQGLVGEKGDTGEQGLQGLVGEKGDTGEQGLQASILAVSSVSKLPQTSTILFDTPIDGWESVVEDNIKGFIVPTAGLYLVHYSINGISILERNGVQVPGINSALIQLNSGDVISRRALNFFDTESFYTASIIFVKLS